MRFRSYRAAVGLALAIAVTAGIAACDTAGPTAPEERPTSDAATAHRPADGAAARDDDA